MVQDMIGTTTNDSYTNHHHHHNINGDSTVEADENHFVEPPCCYDNDDQDDGEDGQDDDDHDTTDMKPLQNEENTTISMNPSLVQPKIPVDRQWLQKLLRKYWFTCQYQQQQLPLSSTTVTGNAPPPMFLPLPPEIMKCHAYVCAPMVDQSDLPFRMLCRQYGCNLAYTPMIHAKLFQTSPKYHQAFLPMSVPLVAATTTTTTIPVPFTTTNNNIDTGSSRYDITEMDRPLIAQICGSSMQHVIPTALQLAPYVDAIDINCGCPQNIAKRGNYGAFLLEQETYLLQLVQTLTSLLTIPVTVKVRLLPPLSKSSSSSSASCDDTTNHDIPQKQQRDESVRRSMILYEKLVHLGHVHMICLHGRTRHHKGVRTGPADWDAIREVVQTFGTTIPVIANGSLANQNEIRQCLEYTKADGVMSSEALLEYPPLFHNLIRQDYYHHHQHCRDGGNVGDDDDHGDTPNMNPVVVNGITLAQQYYDLATRFPPNFHGQGSNAIKVIKIHIHRFCHYYLQSDIQIRQLLIDATTTEALWNVIVLLQQQYGSRMLSSTAAATTDQHCHDPSALSWYYRHRRTVRHGDDDDDEGPEARLLMAQMEHERTVTSQIDLVMDDDAAECFNSLFQTNDDE